MTDENQMFEGGAELTAAEVAEFEEHADEIADEVAGIEIVEADDEVKLAGVEVGIESTYRVVNLIGRFCSPNGNWGVNNIDLGTVQHYNGGATPARAWSDPVAWIKFINDLHAQTGRFQAGWRFDGVAYHEFIYNDVVYRTRNYQANLPHCGNFEWNRRGLGLHVAIGGSQRANAATLRTLTQRNADHLAAIGVPRARCMGHMDVGSSACPGTLQADFVRPFRAGQNPGGATPAPSPAPAPAPGNPSPAPNALYRVHAGGSQRGAFGVKVNALNLASTLLDSHNEVRIAKT